MGKKARKQAEGLGLTKLPIYRFYGRARGLKMKFSKTKPKFVNHITEFLRGIDPSTVDSEGAKNMRSLYYQILSPEAGTFVEVFDNVVGFNANMPKNRVFQMDIYTQNQNIVKDIVRIVNNRFEDGILNHLDFKKIEKKYKVKKDDVINAWNSFLQ
jgi:hypothetical protein